MAKIVGTMKGMALALNMNTMFIGINEVPSSSTLRGRWLGDFLHYMERRPQFLENGSVTYVDIWTPTNTSQMELHSEGRMTWLKEKRDIYIHRLGLLSQAIPLYMLDQLSHKIVGRHMEDSPIPAQNAEHNEQIAQEFMDELADAEEGGDDPDPDVIIELDDGVPVGTSPDQDMPTVGE
jgi:hypothetical protein